MPEGLAGHAAVTDQSDGWAGVLLAGEAGRVAQALARLVPVDLRPAAFPAVRVLRAPVNHMSAIVLRRTEGVELWVFRSMARTLWHELTECWTGWRRGRADWGPFRALRQSGRRIPAQRHKCHWRVTGRVFTRF